MGNTGIPDVRENVRHGWPPENEINITVILMKMLQSIAILEEQSVRVQWKESQHLAGSALVLYHLHCQSEPLLTQSALQTGPSGTAYPSLSEG